MNEELTYDEGYNLTFEVEVSNFSAEYAECGSHKILIKAITDLIELQSLFKELEKVKGIKD